MLTMIMLSEEQQTQNLHSKKLYRQRNLSKFENKGRPLNKMLRNISSFAKDQMAIQTIHVLGQETMMIKKMPTDEF